MKNNVLRGPLIKSAVLLIVLSLLVYITGTSPEGSIWNSIGVLFIGIFRAAQLAVGLLLALTLCILVLFGIFIGAIAMVSKESAAGMYEYLVDILRENFVFIRSKIRTDPAVREQALKEEINASVNVRLNDLKKTQAEYYLQLQSLSARLDALEGRCAALAEAGQVDALAQDVTGLTEKQAALEANVGQVQTSCQELAAKVGGLNFEGKLAEVAARLDAMEGSKTDPGGLDDLRQQVEKIEKDVETAKSLAAEAAEKSENAMQAAAAAEDIVGETSGGNVENHRLCTYFANEEDCRKLIDLVVETLGQDMTYAQVTDYVVGKMDKNAADVIESHPSLMKDFIRQCRSVVE